MCEPAALLFFFVLTVILSKFKLRIVFSYNLLPIMCIIGSAQNTQMANYRANTHRKQEAYALPKSQALSDAVSQGAFICIYVQ